MRLVCISDTHSLHRAMIHPLPDGDLLIHSGDFTHTGAVSEMSDFCRWFEAEARRYPLGAILISGNHDRGLDRDKSVHAGINREWVECCPKIRYLDRLVGTVTLGGVLFYGCPYTPESGRWAFQIGRGTSKHFWANELANGLGNCEVAITHGPPWGIGDEILEGEHVGDDAMLEAFSNCENLKLHVCGHIHAGYGARKHDDVTFINAAICDDAYKPVNEPIVCDI